jgi:hypothetical protein
MVGRPIAVTLRVGGRSVELALLRKWLTALGNVSCFTLGETAPNEKLTRSFSVPARAARIARSVPPGRARTAPADAGKARRGASGNVEISRQETIAAVSGGLHGS